MRDANTRGGIFGSQEMFGGGLFDGTISGGFGQYEQAAAGLGEYFDNGGQPGAFDEGVFGYHMGERAGLLQAYDDGSLGLVEQAEAGLGGGWSHEAGERWLGGMGDWADAQGCRTVAAFNTCDNDQFSRAQQDCYALRDAQGGDYRPYIDFDSCVRSKHEQRLLSNCVKYCPGPSASDYPWGSVSEKTRALQRDVNQQLDWLGYQNIGVDGKLGATTCGAAKYVSGQGAKNVTVPSTCKSFSFTPVASDKLCPEGTKFDGSDCVPVPCPAGQVRASSGKCVAAGPVTIICDVGQQMINGKCVAITGGCPAGQQMISGKCAPIAPPGKSKMTMWLVGGGLVAAGIVTAIYFGTRKKAT